MAPRSLSQMCERHITRNIRELVHIGTLTYAQVAHLLAKVESPAQLRRLEEWSPQLLGDDAELWQKFIARDFPVLSREKNWAPKNPLSWSKVYDKYKREHDMELKEAEAKMAQGFAAIEAKVQSRTSKIVDRRLLPGKGGERRRPIDRQTSPPRSNLQKFLRKSRGQARELIQRRTLPIANGGMLAVRPGQIKRAPEMMVNDLRIKAQPDIRAMPTKLTPAKQERTLREQKDKEARLLAAKQKLASQGVTFVSDGEDSEAEVGEPSRTSPVKKADQPDASESRLLAAKRKRPEPTVVVDSDSDGALPEAGDLFGDEPPAKRIKQSSLSPAKPSTSQSASHKTASATTIRASAPGLLSASYRPPSANPAVRRVAAPKPASSSSTPVKNSATTPIKASSSPPARLSSTSLSKEPPRSARDTAAEPQSSTKIGTRQASSPVLMSASPEPSPAPYSSLPTGSGTALQLNRKKKRPANIFMPLSKIAKR